MGVRIELSSSLLGHALHLDDAHPEAAGDRDRSRRGWNVPARESLLAAGEERETELLSNPT